MLRLLGRGGLRARSASLGAYGGQQCASYSKISREQAATELPQSVRSGRVNCVVIGGGMLGVSTLYHLAKLGVTDAVLLERSELTAGSTWHAAGLTTAFHPGNNMRLIHDDSLKLFRELENDTEGGVGLHLPGSIRLVTSQQRLDEALYQMSKSRNYPAQQRFINPNEISEMCPLVNLDGVIAGIHTADDGHVAPADVTMELAKRARSYGASVVQGVAVRGLRRDSAASAASPWTVETDRFTLQADHVVNCGGLWAQEIGQMAGVRVPVASIQHQYIISESIPEVQQLPREFPVMRDLEASYYLRAERGGLLVGPYEKAHKMRVCDEWHRAGTPGDFGSELFDEDLERIQEHLEMAMERFPALASAGIASVVNGPINYSADGYPLIGPTPEHRNLWLACGFGYGIVHGPGAGKYLAEWIVRGEAPFELAETDPARFGAWTTKPYVAAKVRETYAMNNAISYPHEERYAGRPARVSPLYARLQQYGADFGMVNGWEKPNWFRLGASGAHSEETVVSSMGLRVPAHYEPSFRRSHWFEPVARECHAVMSAVGVTDITPFSKFEVRGPAATRFLDRLVANTLPKEGRCNISHMLSKAGRVLSELTVTRWSDDHYYVVSGATNERSDLRWMQQQHAEMALAEGWINASDSATGAQRQQNQQQQLHIENVTDRLAVIGVAGPRSRDLMQQLLPFEDLSARAWPFLAARRVHLGAAELTAIRISFTGELGWELHCPVEYALTVYDAIKAAGAAFGIVDFGAFAMNSLRLEKGFRVAGVDMNRDHSPLEAGLDKFVQLDKATDFVGRQALLAEQAEGAIGQRQKQVYLEVATQNRDADVEGTEALWSEGECVGYVTSGSFGHTTGRGVAFAYITEPHRRQHLLREGAQLQVEMLGSMVDATVREQPLVDIQVVRSRKAKQQDNEDRRPTQAWPSSSSASQSTAQF